MTNLSIFSRSKSKSKTHARTRTQPQFQYASSTREKYVLSSRFMGFSFILDHYRDWTHLSKSKHLLYTLFLLHFVRFGGQRQKNTFSLAVCYTWIALQICYHFIFSFFIFCYVVTVVAVLFVVCLCANMISVEHAFLVIFLCVDCEEDAGDDDNAASINIVTYTLPCSHSTHTHR